MNWAKPIRDENKKTGWPTGVSVEQGKNIKLPLITNDGQNFGEISFNAYKAIENNRLDSYTPVNDVEKNILDNYIKHISKFTPATTYSVVEEKRPVKKDSFGNWLGKQAFSGLASFNKGIASTLDFILPTEFLGKYDYWINVNKVDRKKRNYSIIKSASL